MAETMYLLDGRSVTAEELKHKAEDGIPIGYAGLISLTADHIKVLRAAGHTVEAVPARTRAHQGGLNNG